MKKSVTATFVSFAIALSSCAKAPDGNDVTGALGVALKAETLGSSVEKLANGKSLATNFDGGRQFLIAKKVGNVPGQSQCGLFDITVSRPSSQFSLFGSGDSSSKTKVKVCIP